jgi:pSer/pThr/pTyr-binding forkhead associated (FHA) protein
MVKLDTSNYIQLETINREKGYVKTIHIISLNNDKKKVTIGRGHNADIKINDISVSRVHALITLTEEGYVLEDNESKFGSLMLVGDKSCEIKSGKGMFLQMGRTVLGLTVKESEKVLVPSNPIKSKVVK